MPKILITGTFSSGKTTLFNNMINFINDMSLEFTYISDTSRECPLPINSNQDANTSAWLMGKQIERESLASHLCKGLILCDRGIPDIAGHTQTIDHQTLQLEIIVTCLKAWVETYDLIFIAKYDPNISIRNDGIREINQVLQKAVEENILQFLSTHKNTLVLPQDTDDRLKFMDKYLFKAHPAFLGAGIRSRVNIGSNSEDPR